MKEIVFFLFMLVLLIIGCEDFVNKDTKEIGVDVQTDEHGCLLGAGYLWDKDIGACIGNLELDENQRKAANIAVKYLNSMKGVTISEVVTLRCHGCFFVNGYLHLNSGDKSVKVRIDEWAVTEVIDNSEVRKRWDFGDCEKEGNSVGITEC